MNDDRELLEAAARAAGITHVDYTGIPYDGSHGLMLIDEVGRHLFPWNPLTDDGDESRLEAALRLSVRWGHTCVVVGEFKEHYADHSNDRQAARRRAGVRAAAEIGRAS